MIIDQIQTLIRHTVFVPLDAAFTIVFCRCSAHVRPLSTSAIINDLFARIYNAA